MSDPNQPYGAVPPPPYPPPGAPPVGPPSGPPFPAPPGSGGGDKSGNGLWIALAVVGVVALVGVIVALVLVLTADDKDADADKADDVTSSATSATSASESSPTEEPTDSATTSATPTDTSPTTGGPGGVSTADAVPNDPKAVVEAFLSSVLSGDCATAEDLVTEEYIEEEGDCDPDDIPSDFADQITYTVGAAKVNNAAGTATVPVDADFAGTSESSTVELVKVGGLWRVSEFN